MRALWKIVHCYFWFQETNCISKYTASKIQPGCGFINPESFPGILSQSQRQLVENPRGMGIHSFDFMNCSTGLCLNVKRRNKNVVLSVPAQGDSSENVFSGGIKNLSLSQVPGNTFIFWQHAGAWMKELPKCYGDRIRTLFQPQSMYINYSTRSSLSVGTSFPIVS